mmetsp:Transcript_353/g.730  ORF Transcript_353/g.730 Transcript_353/m.730 type:complete len:83 (-) Transcript_353:52-300(-)
MRLTQCMDRTYLIYDPEANCSLSRLNVRIFCQNDIMKRRQSCNTRRERIESRITSWLEKIPEFRQISRYDRFSSFRYMECNN